MANILYRTSTAASTPGATTAKAAPLSNLEIDGNFKSLNDELILKAPLASPTFTGTVSGISAAMVGAPTGSGTSTGTNTGDQTPTSLGLVIGTNVQAYDADLTSWAGIAPSVKQDTLVSGTNIKTVGGTSLLGSGDVRVGMGDMLLTGIQSVTGLKTFNPSKLAMKGSSTGVTTFATANASGTGYTITFPAATGTVLTNAAPVTVAEGGTGRATSTTAYGLIAAGTTATGAQQTLTAGATTAILVGGGASALPVWTTATGSGAPVRATSPTLVTPDLGTPSSGTLTNCTFPTLNQNTTGTAANATNVAVTNNTATATAMYPTFVAANTGNNPINTTSAKLTFVPSTGVLGATKFTTGAASWYTNSSYAVADATAGFVAAIGGVGKFTVDPTNVRSNSDNSILLGTAAFRWSVVYAGTGTISTSDAREKTEVREFNIAEIRAATQLSREIGVYQWLASVAAKGDAARAHIGLTVQRAIEVMRLHGLDPFAYGFICYDAWEGSDNEVTGRPEAGDRYSFRYDELTLFIVRGIDARLSALEA